MRFFNSSASYRLMSIFLQSTKEILMIFLEIILLFGCIIYAAGECTGGIHGAVRIGANAVMDCLVNGKLAGETVIKDAKK